MLCLCSTCVLCDVIYDVSDDVQRRHCGISDDGSLHQQATTGGLQQLAESDLDQLYSFNAINRDVMRDVNYVRSVVDPYSGPSTFYSDVNFAAPNNWIQQQQQQQQQQQPSQHSDLKPPHKLSSYDVSQKLACDIMTTFGRSPIVNQHMTTPSDQRQRTSPTYITSSPLMATTVSIQQQPVMTQASIISNSEALRQSRNWDNVYAPPSGEPTNLLSNSQSCAFAPRNFSSQQFNHQGHQRVSSGPSPFLTGSQLLHPHQLPYFTQPFVDEPVAPHAPTATVQVNATVKWNN